MTEPAISTPSTGTSEKAPAESRAADPFAALRRRMERLVDDFQTGFPALGRDIWASDLAAPVREWVGGNWGAMDVTETDQAYRVAVELPGCEEKDIDVSAANGMVSIKAEKKQEKADEKAHVTERHYGSYQRSFRLPEGVDREKIEASYRNGVLEITLPKTEQAKQDARKIEIRSS
ncbi:Hsp20/alpha crystallin family protein [Lutibaculum baratangense]|uniref:Putative small heat shock protein n=1 Tax=Lutibaculum baratangense AMV1 TaxID=631454 RepID=V4RJ79_9HYPH|nr:Hsp20/alpha crystallin family protein [Lutibaculum baratangense]ESR26146.1 putative small heat shock protein [Lutibaculum baratangense AMV1]